MIRNQRNVETLVQIPAGHMRFIPAHKQTDGDIASLAAAKWSVDLVLISNATCKEHFVNMDRIHQVLAPALCSACQMTSEHINFFPAR